MPTATWLSPQFAKRQALKFRLGTYVTPLRGPPYPLFEQLGPILFSPSPNQTPKKIVGTSHKDQNRKRSPLKTPPNHTLLDGTCPFRPKQGSVPIPLPS